MNLIESIPCLLLKEIQSIFKKMLRSLSRFSTTTTAFTLSRKLLINKNNDCPFSRAMMKKQCFSKAIQHQDMREVINKETALTEIDSLLGKKKAPAFEYIYVTPSLLTTRIFSSDSSVNPYGHSAIRYTNPEDGKSIVMNSRYFNC